ncbi:diacetyl reductase [Xenorhabdus cabanillasii JM26]|nr:diacetyl reductase [Xenorhabdus cabanillasii JM26]
MINDAGIVGTDVWVEIDERFVELTGAEKGATYKKFVDGIALGRSQTPDDVADLVNQPPLLQNQ